MMKKRQHAGGGLLMLLLFSVFAVCILSVLLTGADAYQRLTERGQDSFERRTAAQYLTTRVHQGDAAGCVFTGNFDGDPAGTDTLFLKELIDGEAYYTRIYCREGMLMELFSGLEDGLQPEDGDPLLPVQALAFSEEQGCITAEITEQDGTVTRLHLLLRSGEEAAP